MALIPFSALTNIKNAFNNLLLRRSHAINNEDHLSLERAIFQMNLRDDISLPTITDHILKGIERLYPDAIGSILMLSEDNKLQHYSAPSLPAGYIQLINGTVPGPSVGSCGTAAATNKVIVVSNIETDPLWANYRIAATQFGLKACWSVPIPHSKRGILGTFAIYHRYPKAPSRMMLQYVERWAQLTGILYEYNELLENLRLLNERHHLAGKATHDMLWDWDLEKDVVYRNEDSLRSMTGFTDTGIRHVSDWIARIHPEDRSLVLDQVEGLKKHDGQPYMEVEYRFLRADDTYMHIYDRAYIIKDNSGKAIRMIGAAQDITERITTQRQLRQSEEQYRYLFASNPLPMWIFDMDTLMFLEVNQMAVQQYGYTAEEFYRMSIYDIRPCEEHARLRAITQSCKTDQQVYDRGSWRHKKKNGDIIQVEIFSHTIDFRGKKGMLVLANDITQNIALQEQLTNERALRHQQVMKATIAMQEKARNEIAHELHDNVNQLLGASKLYLEAKNGDEPLAEEYRLEGISLIMQAIEEIRRLTRSLTPPMLSEAGIISAVHDLIHHITRVQPIAFDFHHEGFDEKAVSNTLQLALFRIIQEQSNNILKYARASKATISINMRGPKIQLCISDNGVGFDPYHKKNGVGFTNILNRAIVYNGKVEIASSPGNGCILTVYVECKALLSGSLPPDTNLR